MPTANVRRPRTVIVTCWFVALALVLAVMGIGWSTYAARSGYNYTLMMALGGAVMLALVASAVIAMTYIGCHGAYNLTPNPFACTPRTAHANGMH